MIGADLLYADNMLANIVVMILRRIVFANEIGLQFSNHDGSPLSLHSMTVSDNTTSEGTCLVRIH